MNFRSTIQWATPYSLGLVLALAVVAAAGFVLLRWTLGRPIAAGGASGSGLSGWRSWRFSV